MRHLGRAILCALVGAGPVSAVQDWKDPSPHTTRLITVDEGVQLEVLEWLPSLQPGGQRRGDLVVLAGGGATAHHYDDFAPELTARGYRVVGITRRGHRGSSAATGGYGFVRLAEDIVRVIDAMKVVNPLVIGESFAGEEMHVLGARYPSRIRALVYVDAAFDRGDDEDEGVFNPAARAVPGASSPQDADLQSFATLRAYLEKYGGAGPEAYLRTRYRTNPDGTIAGLWAPERSVFQAMTQELRGAYKPYKPERITVPALAIYACPQSADDLMRRGSSDRSPYPELVAMAAADPDLRARVETLYQLTRARVQKHIKWFQTFTQARARVVELSGNHDLIVSNPREVLRLIDEFASSLRGPMS